MITLSEYILLRLKQLDIKYVFGVPGEYNLALIDGLLQDKEIKWVNCVDELSAAYTSDGYARIKGMAVLLTSFGVGELTAFNGIAGAFAEFVPLIHIVGSPPEKAQEKTLCAAHALPNQSCRSFCSCFKPICAATLRLNNVHSTFKIDMTLANAIKAKQPVYLELPADLAVSQVKEPVSDIELPTTIYDDLASISLAKKIINTAHKPLLLLDLKIVRYPELVLAIGQLLDNSGLPFLTTHASKGIIRETHPNFCGIYNGNASTDTVKLLLNQCDLILHYFPYPGEVNSGIFNLDAFSGKVMNIYSQEIYYQGNTIGNISALLLTNQLSFKENRWWDENKNISFNANLEGKNDDFWYYMNRFLRKSDLIASESGLIGKSTLSLKLLENSQYLCQNIWSANGFIVPALLGAMLASPLARSILFIRKSTVFQSLQELALFLKLGLKPLIFVVNQHTTDGISFDQKDLPEINYSELPRVLGADLKIFRATSLTEFNLILTTIETANDLCLVETVFPVL